MPQNSLPNPTNPTKQLKPKIRINTMARSNVTPLAFPNITPSSEKAIIELTKFLNGRVDNLDHPSCKYSPALKRAIRALARLEEAPPVLQTEDVGDIDIALESRALYNSLKTTLKTVDKMETNEKVQIFRTATALMEKLLSLQEKAVALEQFTQFKDIVMNTLDRFLSPVQISEFIAELEELKAKD
jgi:hypothetical protein